MRRCIRGAQEHEIRLPTLINGAKMELKKLQRLMLDEWPSCKQGDRLVKSNILYIDGRNLHRSRLLDYHPLGRNEEIKAKLDSPESIGANNDSILSRYVREILTSLCRSDSRYYSRQFGVSSEDYKEGLEKLFVS